MSYTQLNQVLQAGAQPIIEIAMGKRGAAGANGADGAAGATGPAGPTGPVGPSGGLLPGAASCVLWGGSQDARNHYELDASIQISGGVATLQVPEAPLVHDEAFVSIGQSNPQDAIENVRKTGRLTRVGSQTFTMAVPGAPNGSGTTKIRFLDHYHHSSWFRHTRDFTNGAVEVIANMAQGGERTIDALNRLDEAAAFNADLYPGSWNIGNDVDNSTSPSVNPEFTLTRLDTMIDRFTKTMGKFALIYGPPATPTLTAAVNTIGRTVMDGIVRRVKANPKLIWQPTFDWTVNPETGQGYPELFATPTDIHWNQDSCLKLGALLAPLVVRFTGSLPDPLVQSPLDRVDADATSLQICPGFWSDTEGVVDASTLSGRMSGQILPGFTGAQISGTSNVACSIHKDPNGYGWLQRFVFTGPTGGQFAIDYAGAGNAMAARLKYGVMYDVAEALGITQSVPGVLKDWNAFIAAGISGTGYSVNARLASWMRVSPTGANAVVQGNYKYGRRMYPPFKTPTIGSASSIVRFAKEFTLAADGSLTIDFGRPTFRQRSTL